MNKNVPIKIFWVNDINLDTILPSDDLMIIELGAGKAVATIRYLGESFLG